MGPQNETPCDFREKEKRAKETCVHCSVFTLLSQVIWERETAEWGKPAMNEVLWGLEISSSHHLILFSEKPFNLLLLKGPIYCWWQNHQSWWKADPFHPTLYHSGSTLQYCKMPHAADSSQECRRQHSPNLFLLFTCPVRQCSVLILCSVPILSPPSKFNSYNLQFCKY